MGAPRDEFDFRVDSFLAGDLPQSSRKGRHVEEAPAQERPKSVAVTTGSHDDRIRAALARISTPSRQRLAKDRSAVSVEEQVALVPQIDLTICSLQDANAAELLQAISGESESALRM